MCATGDEAASGYTVPGRVRRLALWLTAATTLVVFAASAESATNTISTVAGTGTSGSAGDGLPAVNAQLSGPVEVEQLADGGYLIVEQGTARVRRVSAAGIISTVAGNGTPGFSGDGGPATSAQLRTPNGVAVRTDGGILIADSLNHRVRLVAPNGTMSTVAGTGAFGFNGDGIAATAAQLNFPSGVAALPDGSFLIADNDNHRIRRVSAAGTISTVAGTGELGTSGDGGPATAAAIAGPANIDRLPDGSYLISTSDDNRIRRVAANGTISTVAGTGAAGSAGDGGPATAAQLNLPVGIAALPTGGFVIGERVGHRVRRVAANGIITTIAGTGAAGFSGDGGPATAGQLNLPLGVAVTVGRDILVADALNQRVRLIDAGDPPPRNVKPPTIRDDGAVGRLARYRCAPGTWVNIPAGATFVYSWWKPAPLFGIGLAVPVPRKLADGPTFVPTAAQAGTQAVCRVDLRAGFTRVLTAESEPAILSGTRAVKVFPILLQPYGNLRVRGIDVVQTVQPLSGAGMFLVPRDGGVGFGFPTDCGGGTPTAFVSDCGTTIPPNPALVTYRGVPLDARKAADVFVYVDVADGKPASATEPVDVTLRARAGGRLLSGTLTRTVKNPPTRATPWVTLDERLASVNSVRFSMPASWLAVGAINGEKLQLEATVSLHAGSPYTQCLLFVVGPSCGADDRFTLRSIDVNDRFPDLTVRSLPLLTDGQSVTGPGALAPPESVLGAALRLYPGTARVSVLPYDPSISIQAAATAALTDDACKAFVAAGDLRGCRGALVTAAINMWRNSSPANRTGYDILLAVHRYAVGALVEPGWNRGNLIEALSTGNQPIDAVNDGSAGRPMTAAAHEFGHSLRLPHADDDTTLDGAGNGRCGGNRNGQVGETWLPDHEGRLQGVRVRSVGFSARFLVGDTAAAQKWDLMSYCATEGQTWLSARNWNRTMLLLHDLYARQRVSGPPRVVGVSGSAFVTGILSATGGSIVAVTQADPGNLTPLPDNGSLYTVRALDAAGTVLKEAPVAITPLQTHSVVPAATFSAAIPATAAVVELRSGVGLLDRLVRSRPPTLRVLAPRGPGAPVGGTGRAALVVRLAAGDPDGDALRLVIEQSTGRPGGWHTVYDGPMKTRISIPGRLLLPGARSRLRVSVSDGFNRTRGLSGTFRARGAPPSAQLLSPDITSALQAGVPTELLASAVDGTGKRLRGRALTWFAGSRRLGFGERLRVSLPAGTQRLRLRVRDAGGRERVVTRRVTVAPVALRFTTLRVPEHVKAGARNVAIRVSSTIAAGLRLNGRSYAIGTRARRILIALPRGPRSGVLKLRFTLVPRGGKTAATDATVFIVRS